MALRRVKYVGRYPEVEFVNGAGQWVTVKHGGHVDVPTSLADSLAEQTDNWQIVDTKAEKPTVEQKDGD